MTALHPGATARHLAPIRPMRIAVIGSAGAYCLDDTEETLDELGSRLARHGHDLTVYGARSPLSAGLRRVRLPAASAAVRTALTAAHLAVSRRHDVVLVLDAASAPLVPLLRARGAAVALHVGGLDWKREERGSLRRRRARAAEQAAVRDADALIVDSRALQDYYDDEFAVPVEVIAAGTPILRNTPSDLLESLGLVPGGFHLTAARFEPDHHVGLIAEAYHRSDAHLPLVVLGAAGSHDPRAAAVRALAERDGRIRLIGDVHEPRLLDQLFAHAVSSVHGRSLGGADPMLLRAMGGGTPVLAWDVVFNREALGTAGLFFDGAPQLTRQIEEVERYPMRFAELGTLMRERARTRHDWDQIAEAYEVLASKLSRGWSTRGMVTGRRRGSVWARDAVGAGPR